MSVEFINASPKLNIRISDSTTVDVPAPPSGWTYTSTPKTGSPINGACTLGATGSPWGFTANDGSGNQPITEGPTATSTDCVTGFGGSINNPSITITMAVSGG